MRLFPYSERLLAYRYLKSKRRDGFISVIAGFSFLGITLGVATLIIVMSVMNGFRIELVNQILGINGHASIYAYGRDISDYENKIDKISNISGVKKVSAVIEGQVLVSHNERQAGVAVRAPRSQDLEKMLLMQQGLQQGSYHTLQDGQHIALGSKLAQQLGVGLNDKITIISPKGRATPFGTAPRIKSYTIGAIFTLGMSLYDSNFVFMDMLEAQNFFIKPNQISNIDIYIDNPDDIAQFRGKIYQALQDEQLIISTWQESNATYLSALAVERTVMFIILSLIILVAALNIISGMIMLVKDKSTDIAVLRTIGASKNSIMRIFLMTGAAIGIIGTFCGVIIGALFCAYIDEIRVFISNLLGISLFDPAIYFLAKMPAEMTLEDTVKIVVMSLTLSIIAGIFPARRAAKLDPVEVLRYE
jgi:lipoprotein-releasing system permease protein